jgi:NDP-sugar pyrophosphorylase family protein
MFSNLPKAMIPFGDRPFLEIQMGMLAKQGFTSFVLCVGHQADHITDHFGDGKAWGWEIAYSREPHPLGTGGALRYALHHLDATSIVLNGDTYLPMDYLALVKKHTSFDKGIGTVTVVEMEDTRRYGQVVVDKHRRIQAFREKTESSGPGFVNAGVYVFEPQILQHIPAEGRVSLERDVIPSLLIAGVPLHAYTAQQEFIDFGTPEGYRKLQQLLE